jgi:flavin-dependent dehydrogenase
MEDVIIIGGGPAGSTAASYLTMLGRKVLVLERDKFPRDHVGESLLPFCYPLLKEIGVMEEMERYFVRKPSVRFVNKEGEIFTNWCFNHVILDESHLSFQVDRKVFDTILLNNSRRLGATVKEETKVSDVVIDSENDVVKVTAVGPDGVKQEYQGRFLIDASGRDNFMATKNRWRQPNKGFERTALWTHWINVKEMKGGLEEGSSIIAYIGGEKRGWIWVFPLERDRVTAGVVMDSFYLRDRKRELQEQGSQDWQMDLYNQELSESPFVKDLLKGADPQMGLFVEGDYSYNSDVKYGPRYALVGDASRFIDPIFSSGIYLSMKSASLVAQALHQMLGDHLDNNQPLLDAYKQINGAYDLVFKLISLFYNPHSISFADAASFFKEHKEHEDAMAAGHFILSGDFFKNNEKYNEFLALLADPRYFKFYKKTVIDRKNFNIKTCEVDRSLVFPELSLREVM